MTSSSKSLSINREVVISCFNTIDYYSLNKDFYQIPDAHPYWEMVYVDNGTIISNYGGIGHTISEGEVIFHPPQVSHSHVSNRVDTCSVLVVSFTSESKLLQNLSGKTFFLSSHSKAILSRFMEECNTSLGNINNSSGGIPQQLSRPPALGSSQLLECYFVELLYSIIRSSLFSSLEKNTSSRKLASNSFIEIINMYLKDNIYKNLSLDDLCNKFDISKSNLCKRWKEHFEIGIIDYFISLKIDEAKRLLKSSGYSITEIANLLSYSTIHHFSHSFKKIVGCSPREYKNSDI